MKYIKKYTHKNMARKGAIWLINRLCGEWEVEIWVSRKHSDQYINKYWVYMRKDDIAIFIFGGKVEMHKNEGELNIEKIREMLKKYKLDSHWISKVDKMTIKGQWQSEEDEWEKLLNEEI